MDRRTRFISINEGFECERCGAHVSPHPAGSCRNHCTVCLWSKHVDGDVPGDRSSICDGLMEPVGLTTKKGIMYLVHKCTQCSHQRLNKKSPDDSENVLIGLSKKPF